ncbi:hypothetical protein LZ017_08705 [Pelomonas sp. CA6]|uniref:hypothetical protein n=1 Tax=Pelomonas sp. CA6 TaxID=2907999 RepID=UPI001F4BF103|nr:hypothetical protein [Pelomonas sp. CA6]MCH7343456.1 hypothetical protein [Pelomonas sp. CA6]
MTTTTVFKPSDLMVLVGPRIDPTCGRATRSRADAATVALAQQALGPAHEPRLCSAGALPAGVMRDYLAQGLSRLTHLALPDEATQGELVAALAYVCRDAGLVLCGARGEAGMSSGMLPYALAQRLNRPLIHDVIDLQREKDGGWRVLQARPRGARRCWRLEPGVAAVLVCSPRLAQREDLPQRHAWASAQAGRIEELRVAASAHPGGATAAPWQLEPTRKQRRPLAAASQASGAERMARATGAAEPAGRGGTVLHEGSALDKARQLLDHLRQRALIPPQA